MTGRGWLLTISIIGTIVVAGVVLLATHWPFTRQAVAKALRAASSGAVEIKHFRRIYFPHPGCIAEDVVIHHPDDPSGPPLITVSRLTMVGDYLRLLRFSKNLDLIQTEGMHIRIRAGNQPASAGGDPKYGAQIRIDTLIADRTVLEFASKEAGTPPFVILIRYARLSPVSGREPVHYVTDLRIPTPPGEVHSEGQLGPWNAGDPFATAASGSYRLRDANLGFARGIAGILQSEGVYRGSIRHIEVSDAVTVPDFRVASAQHKLQVDANVQATVNGETGDVVLQAIRVHLANSEITGNGSISGPDGGDKAVSLALAVPHGRIDDFLYLLTQSAHPGLRGDLVLRTTATLPADSRPFLEKLRMKGSFQIGRAYFTEPPAEQSLDRIRDKSRHEPADYAVNALSNLRGDVLVRDGQAQLSNITFDAPGVSARLSGTYNLLTTTVDLRGGARLQTSLSSATTGIKSFFLKLLNPFFKSRGHKGSDVPIKIAGSWGHTSIALDLRKK